jgi:hypothetical protein
MYHRARGRISESAAKVPTLTAIFPVYREETEKKSRRANGGDRHQRSDGVSVGQTR